MAGCGGRSCKTINDQYRRKRCTFLIQITIYSDGAMNSIVLVFTSGRRVTSPYDLLVGSYWNSSGTAAGKWHEIQIKKLKLNVRSD